MNMKIPVNRYNNSSVLLCINTILKMFTSPSDQVASIDNDFVLDVPVFNDFPHLSTDMEKYPFFPDIYVADLEKIDLRLTLEDLKQNHQLNPRAKFLLVAKNVTPSITQILSEYYITNVVLIDSVSGNMSTYYPYKKKELYDVSLEITEVGNCWDSFKNNSIKPPLFDNKIPEIWTKSPIKMCLMFEPPYSICGNCEEKGINVNIFELVVKFLNLTPTWTLIDFPEDGDFYPYYYKYLYSNEYCDIHVGLIPDYFYDFTTFYLFDDLYLFAPSPDLLPRWQYLIKALTMEIWMCWIFTILALSCLWWIFRRVQGRHNNLKEAMEIMWTNIEYFVEQYHYISSGRLSLKVLAILILFLSCLMNMIFKCNFNYILTGINFQESIDSVEDIIKREMSIGFVDEYFRDLFEKGTYFKSHSLICNYSYLCFNQTAFEKNLISYQSWRFYKYIQDSYVDEDGIPLMRLLKPHVLSVFLTGLLPLGHPVTQSVNKHLSYLDAHGFIKFILSKYDANEIQTPSNFKARTLSFEHILAPSVILLIGFIFGLIMFVLEVYQYI